MNHPTYNKDETRRQIHAHTHTLDMESLILKEAGFTGKSRDIIDAIVGAAGTRVSPQVFEMDHLTLARRLNHPGSRNSNKRDKKAAITYVSRKLKRLEKEMRQTGVMVVRIVRGHEEQRTRYEVFLTPVANRAYQRALASELWKVNPGKAKSEQVVSALSELPPYESDEQETTAEETDEKMISRNLSTIATLAQKTFDAIARKGGSPKRRCDELAKKLQSLAERAEQRQSLEEQKAQGTGRRYVIKRNDAAAEGGDYKSVDTPPDMLAAALSYARRGIPVFPVKSDKTPLTARGFKDATTDEEQINAWWAKHPGAGIGVPTGEASGLLVLDIDQPHGAESLAALEREHGKLPETLEAETPRCGRHMIFKYPQGPQINNSAGKLGICMDVRGAGGYYVAAPSLHKSGRRYRLLNDRAPADVPEWLIKLLTEPKGETQAAHTEKARPQASSGPAIEGLITEGRRNATLFKLACGERGRGATLAELEAFCLEVNAKRLSPPLPDSETLKIARSAASYAPNSASVMSQSA